LKNAKPLFKLGSIYYIEWDDHWGSSGWYFNGTQGEDLEPAPIKSIGWVVGESDSILRIAGTLCNNGSNATMNIIKMCITKYWELTGIEV